MTTYRKTLAIDPGIRGCGVALFDGGLLEACAYVKNPVKEGDGPEAVFGMVRAVLHDFYSSRENVNVVFEHPRIYTVSKSKGDNNDLLPLVAVGYVIAAQYPVDCSTRVYPHEWKQTMPKDVCAARVLSRLDTAERAVLDSALTKAGSKGHNIVDACGIALHFVGRFAPKRSWEK